MYSGTLIRYGEIGTKSEPVRSQMEKILRQRIEDRLNYDEIEFEKVSVKQGRIYVKSNENKEIAKIVSEIPGVASTSPVLKSGLNLEDVKNSIKKLHLGKTFGISINRANKDISSKKFKENLGDFIREYFESEVDLDNPQTWVNLDIREEEIYIFTKKFKGPQGYPVGSGDNLGALISGGIDSPVAAYELMSRGCKITPIYFYNRPIAAEDHHLRFRSAISNLKKFNPSKNWRYILIDMEEINKKLMNIGKGRMIIHRRIMFKIAQKLASERNWEGLVSGESTAQKSSQTISNLKITSKPVNLPIHRPLLTYSKNKIVEKAKKIGTFEDAKIRSACKSLSPNKPTTNADINRINKLEERYSLDKKISKAFEKKKVKEI